MSWQWIAAIACCSVGAAVFLADLMVSWKASRAAKKKQASETTPEVKKS